MTHILMRMRLSGGSVNFTCGRLSTRVQFTR
jgi:hypothetical protein